MLQEEEEEEKGQDVIKECTLNNELILHNFIKWRNGGKLKEVENFETMKGYEGDEKPVVAGTQSNGNAEPKSSQDAGFKPSNEVGKKVNEVPRQENECKDQEEKDNCNTPKHHLENSLALMEKVDQQSTMVARCNICQGNPQMDLQEKGVIDSGCSRHITGNMSYFTDYEETDGGYVAFGGNPKGGKISGKGTIKTGKLDFNNVYFVKELKFNLFSVSQMDMNQFCEMKGIMRQYSIARTPQQNGVAKKRNMTLIETGRTMLADSKVPTTFWAEAVNTACYVQNKVLVTKPHNKTPYELFHGKTPMLSFMRPFGYPVTILNTIDHLGKFDEKANEGFFVGYSLNRKAFRVFNSRTRILEETLHIRFIENTPNNVGNVPNWLFDIDALTKTMNYQPIVAGTQSNGNAGTKDNDN
nr:retrovirus-related Pol polyprotein from transposon TNT 1-94 [Tanacetum cinerariifolium]